LFWWVDLRVLQPPKKGAKKRPLGYAFASSSIHLRWYRKPEEVCMTFLDEMFTDSIGEKDSITRPDIVFMLFLDSDGQYKGTVASAWEKQWIIVATFDGANEGGALFRIDCVWRSNAEALGSIWMQTKEVTCVQLMASATLQQFRVWAQAFGLSVGANSDTGEMS
jgi:hypothetical protein